MESQTRRRALLAGGVALFLFAAALAYLLLPRGRTPRGSDEPLTLAWKFLEAVEKEDVDSFMACFSRDFRFVVEDPWKNRVRVDPREYLEASFRSVDFRFVDLNLELESREGDSAVVVTTSGMLHLSPLGVESTMDLEREPLRLKMVLEDGRWCLTENPIPYLL